MKLTPWGSFEGWSGLVRQAVVWAGLPDPGSTRKKLADDSDTDANLLRQLIAGWQEIDPDGKGKTVAEVFALLETDKLLVRYPTLRAALADGFSSKGGTLPSSRSVGMKLHHLRGRVAGGKSFERDSTDRAGAVWVVRD
jgi:hypothetical protein